MWEADNNTLIYCGNKRYNVKNAARYIDVLNTLADPLKDCIELGMTQLETKAVFNTSKARFQDLKREVEPKRTRLTDAEKERIETLYSDFSPTKIAEIMNLDRGIVRRYLTTAGLRR